MEEIWWLVKVLDVETNTTTTISKFGLLEDIRIELAEDGLWQFVSARPEPEPE